MREIYKNLWVGSDKDFKDLRTSSLEGWSIVHAAKEPYHRQMVGYIGRSAPKGHAEYLFGRRGNILTLNLVDSYNPKYISKECIEEAAKFIHERLTAGDKVLLHCNIGESRAPSIGLIFLLFYTDLFQKTDNIEDKFLKLYPEYRPSLGMAVMVTTLTEFWRNKND